jgi:hypothetical protein
MLFTFMNYVASNYRVNEKDEFKWMRKGFLVANLKKLLQLLPVSTDGT